MQRHCRGRMSPQTERMVGEICMTARSFRRFSKSLQSVFIICIPSGFRHAVADMAPDIVGEGLFGENPLPLYGRKRRGEVARLQQKLNQRGVDFLMQQHEVSRLQKQLQEQQEKTQAGEAAAEVLRWVRGCLVLLLCVSLLLQVNVTQVAQAS